MSIEPSSTPPSDAGDGILSDVGASDFGALASFGSPAATPPAPTTPPPPVTPGAVTPPTTSTTPPPTTIPPVTATPSVTPSQDLNSIIKSTVDATAAALRPVAGTTPPPKELTPQEFDRKYGIIRPTEDMVTHLIGQDPKKAVQVLDHLFQANLTAALRMANDVMEAKLEQLNGRYEPHIKSWQQQQERIRDDAAAESFFKANPDLVSRRGLVMRIKDATIAQVQAGTLRFANRDEAFAHVAREVKAVLTEAGVDVSATPPSGGITNNVPPGTVTNHAPAGNGRTMATAATAGRTGTGAPPAAKSVVDEIFGADAR